MYRSANIILSTKGEFVLHKGSSADKLYIYDAMVKSLIAEPINSDAHSEVFYNERKKTFGITTCIGQS